MDRSILWKELGLWTHCHIMALKGYLVGHTAGFLIHRVFRKPRDDSSKPASQ